MTEARMLAEVMIELHIFFDSDMDKVEAWLLTKNLNFGGFSPMDLINIGRISRIYKFVMRDL